MSAFDGEDAGGLFDSEADGLAQLGPPPAALAFPVIGATAFFQEGRFVSQPLTGIAGWWPVEGMAAQPLIASGNIPKSNRNAPLFHRDISRVTSTNVTPLLANETISQWLGSAVDFHIVAVVDADVFMLEGAGMFYRSGVFSSPGGNFGVELYRTGTPGAWQFWAAFYITSGTLADASAFDGWKVAVTEVFGLSAEGRGRVVVQAKAESGNLYVRSGTDAWGSGVAIDNTWVPGIADYPHIGRNYGANYELDGTIRALGFYDSAQPDIGWSDDIAAWAAATFPADSHLTGEWDASYDVFGYYEGYGFWPGKVGPLVPIRRDAVGITASNSPANQAVNGYTAPRFDAVNDYLQAPHVLGAFFAENGREGTAVIALLPRNPVAASLGVPTANTPYANPGPLADTQGYVLLAWADDAGTPKAIAGAYDGQTRDPVAGGLVDVGNGLNDGWQMVTSPASASVEHMLTMRWSAERGLLELAVDNGAFVTYPFLSVLALNGYLLFGTNYAIGTHLDADIGAVRLFRCAITDTERDAVGSELQTVTGWSFGFTAATTGIGDLALAPLEILATGQVVFTGIASLALASFGLASSGGETFTGTASHQLKPLVGAATASEVFTGSGSCALSPLSSSAAGLKVHTGTGSLACSPLSASAAAIEVFTGSGSLALSPLVGATGTGGVLNPVTGSGSLALSSLSCAASGAETFTGTGSLACSPLSASATASEVFTGTGSCALQPLSLASSGTNTPPPRTGTCALDLSPLACSASGAEAFSGSGALALSPLACSGSGSETFTGSASLALSPLLGAAAGTNLLAIDGSGSLALSPLSLAAAGGQGVFFTATASLALSPLGLAASGGETFSGSGTLAMSPLSGECVGAVAYLGAGSLALSPLSLSGSGTNFPLFTGTASLALQALSALADGSEAFTGDASLALASLVAASAGLESFFGEGALVLLPLSVEASGTQVGLPVSGDGSLALSPLGVSASGAEVFEGSASLALARFEVTATGMLVLVPPPELPGRSRLIVPPMARQRLVLGQNALATVVEQAKGVVRGGPRATSRAVLVPPQRARMKPRT